MRQTTINKVKQGEYFKLFIDSTRLWVRNHYDRITKRYSYSPYDDVNKEYFAKASRIVFID